MFLLKFLALLAPSLAHCVDTQLCLLSSYLVLMQKKTNCMCRLAYVPHACYIPVIRIGLPFLTHQILKEIVYLLYLQIYSVLSLVVRFHLWQFHCVPATMDPVPHMNPVKLKQKMNHVHNHRQRIRIKWKGQDWRRQLVQACSGVEEVAAGSTSAIRR